ncbi:MAG: hypothetical protein IJU54_01020 [Alphaproteobacteria bacterium]|nr:hypothetical protein [Alphaproteobacteria bacterium]
MLLCPTVNSTELVNSELVSNENDYVVHITETYFKNCELIPYAQLNENEIFSIHTFWRDIKQKSDGIDKLNIEQLSNRIIECLSNLSDLIKNNNINQSRKSNIKYTLCWILEELLDPFQGLLLDDENSDIRMFDNMTSVFTSVRENNQANFKNAEQQLIKIVKALVKYNGNDLLVAQIKSQRLNMDLTY